MAWGDHGYAHVMDELSAQQLPLPTLTSEMRSMPKAAEISATYTDTVGAAGRTGTGS